MNNTWDERHTTFDAAFGAESDDVPASVRQQMYDAGPLVCIGEVPLHDRAAAVAVHVGRRSEVAR